MIDAIAGLILAAPVGIAVAIYRDHDRGVRLSRRVQAVVTVLLVLSLSYTFGKIHGAEHVLEDLRPGIESLSAQTRQLRTKVEEAGIEVPTRIDLQVVETYRGSEEHISEIGIPMRIIGALCVLLISAAVLPLVIPERNPSHRGKRPEREASDD